MSGTMEEVYEPIRYFEGLLPMKLFPNDDYKSLKNEIDSDPFFYEFTRYYSAYDLCFFREDKLKNTELEENTLLKEICCSSSGKWLIFVNSIAQGHQYKKAILQHANDGKKNGDDLVTFIDSDSRNSTDRAVRDVWENLLEKGTFSSRILITTSVLDNGFSIKDKKLKNIVLFTDDRIEFLQELGRCRLDGNSRLKLYIKIPSPSDIRNWERRYDRYYELVKHTNPDEPYLLDEEISYVRMSSFIGFIQNIWHNESDERRSCISLKPEPANGTVRPVMNQMVPWCVRKMGEAILTYRRYAELDEKKAGILFKLEWLGIKPEYNENFKAEDLLLVDPVTKMEEFLKKYENTVFEKDSEDCNCFAMDFVPLYIAIEGTANINRSPGRALWQHDAMKKRLETLRKHGVNYDLSGDKLCIEQSEIHIEREIILCQKQNSTEKEASVSGMTGFTRFASLQVKKQTTGDTNVFPVMHVLKKKR